MPFDESVLLQQYDVVKLNVFGSTQISKRAAAVIGELEASPNNDKSVIIVLTARAKAASKLISIVEIAKRELIAKDKLCFQYNALTSEMTEIERKPKTATNGAAPNISFEDESDSEEAFETMGARNETGAKKRLVPVMTTYLCATSVKELKSEYG